MMSMGGMQSKGIVPLALGSVIGGEMIDADVLESVDNDGEVGVGNVAEERVAHTDDSAGTEDAGGWGGAGLIGKIAAHGMAGPVASNDIVVVIVEIEEVEEEAAGVLLGGGNFAAHDGAIVGAHAYLERSEGRLFALTGPHVRIDFLESLLLRHSLLIQSYCQLCNDFAFPFFFCGALSMVSLKRSAPGVPFLRRSIGVNNAPRYGFALYSSRLCTGHESSSLSFALRLVKVIYLRSMLRVSSASFALVMLDIDVLLHLHCSNATHSVVQCNDKNRKVKIFLHFILQRKR